MIGQWFLTKLVSKKPCNSVQETYSAYPRGMGAPLPGGMPLVKSFASQDMGIWGWQAHG